MENYCLFLWAFIKELWLMKKKWTFCGGITQLNESLGELWVYLLWIVDEGDKVLVVWIPQKSFLNSQNCNACSINIGPKMHTKCLKKSVTHFVEFQVADFFIFAQIGLFKHSIKLISTKYYIASYFVVE